jgi:hypothetical protein
VFFFSVLVSEVVGFSSVPVGESHWPPSGHPEEHSFFSLVSARCPEVLVAQTCLENKLNLVVQYHRFSCTNYYKRDTNSYTKQNPLLPILLRSYDMKRKVEIRVTRKEK